MAKEKDKYNIHQCICKHCNEQYWAQKRDSKFCNKSCSLAWRNTNDLNLREKAAKGKIGNPKVIAAAKKLAQDPIVQQKRSEATSKQWKDANKKKEMIEAQKQAYKDNPEIIKNRVETCKANPDWKPKLSLAMYKRWDDDYEGMLETCIKPALNNKQTKPEKEYEEYLLDSKIRYIAQYRVETKYFDFYLPDTNTLVEIDGVYYHPENIFDGKKYDKIPIINYHNDLIKNEIAKRNGYKLERIRIK
jgi:very-short-patch-repair endonuclease